MHRSPGHPTTGESGDHSTHDDPDSEFDSERRVLGLRLRQVRKYRRLTLRDVEERSRQDFKASALSAYERGERSISLARLARLAEIYDVEAAELLPPDPGCDPPPEPGLRRRVHRRGTAPAFTSSMGIAIDLARAENLTDPQVAALTRLVQAILDRRDEERHPIVSLRADDIDALALALGTEPTEFVRRLEERGIAWVRGRTSAPAETAPSSPAELLL